MLTKAGHWAKSVDHQMRGRMVPDPLQFGRVRRWTQSRVPAVVVRALPNLANMSTVLWVALGGAMGSVARYGLSGAINYRAHPWGTVAVNVIGALVLGVLVGIWGFHADTEVRVGLAIGLLGGFTTFSTFAVDVIYLWEHGHATTAVVSVAVTLVVGIGAAIAGIAIGRSVAA